MREALTGLLDKSDLALSAARELVEPSSLDPVALLVSDARLRIDYPEDVLVVALAGGTGSGKSSLFNALTGLADAPVGDLRPTTAQPLAAVPTRYPGALDGYLDHLGITRRVDHPGLPLCLVDLPDTDSVEVEHRHRVETIMPRIDVLVWVVDPEKYRDAALHHRYLRPMAGYAHQFVFVLNQVDRLDSGALEAVSEDLRTALDEDGISDPVIFATSLSPLGSPIGVDDLRESLLGMSGRRDVLYYKLLGDLARAAAGIESMIGSPVGYRERLAPVIDQAARLLVGDDRAGAVGAVGEFCEDLAAEVGGPIGKSITAVAARLPSQVNRAAEALPPPGPRRRWRRGDLGTEERLETARSVVSGLLGPVTEVMAVRARALADLADLAVALGRLRPEGPG